MIDPIILEHFRAMKERDDLDAILPEILTGMGLEVLSRPTIGVRQYGADISAVGKDEDGLRKLFLLSVKRGDLSRTEWNGDSDQALRPSLDEIRDAYVRSVAPEHKKLPVVIIVVVGGIVPEKVLPLVNGYMEEKEKENPRFEYRLWTGDSLTKRVLEGALREEIFSSERRALLRKTAALVEEPEMALRQYARLIDAVLNDDDLAPVERVRIMLIATWIVFSWGRDAGNLDVPYDASEQLVLRAWPLLYPIIERDRTRKLEASHVYYAVVSQYLDIWDAFISKKVLPHAGTLHALSFAVGSVEPVDINLAMYDLVGKIALGGLFHLWLSPTGPHFPAMANSTAQKAKRIAIALAKMPTSNPTLKAPMLDQHSSDLGLALLLLCCFEETSGAAAYWNRQAAQALMIAVSMPGGGPRLPSIDPNYEALLREDKGLTEDQLKDATAASTLLPLYGLCARIFGDTQLLGELARFQEKHLTRCNAQTWVPNAGCDDKLWNGNPRTGSAFQDLEIGADGSKLLETLQLECAENAAWDELSAIRLDHWPLVAMACRRSRLPVPPQLWMSLTDDVSVNTDRGVSAFAELDP